MQLNIDGLPRAPRAFTFFVEESGADVFLLQEVSIHYDSSFTFSPPAGFQYVADPYCKSVVLFPSTWTCAARQTSLTSNKPKAVLHFCTVELLRPDNPTPLSFTSFYRSPNARPPRAEWTHMLAKPRKFAILGGDANVSSSLWGGSTRDPYEREVETEVQNAMHTWGWVMANDGSPSRVVARAKPSHLDITLCSRAQSSLLLDAKFVDPMLPSDHLQHVLNFKRSRVSQGPQPTSVSPSAPSLRINTRAPQEAWDAYARRLDRAVTAWEALFPAPLTPTRLSRAHRSLAELVRRTAALELGTHVLPVPGRAVDPPVSRAVGLAQRQYLRAMRTWKKTGLPADKERMRVARAAKRRAWDRQQAGRAGQRAAGLRHGDRRALWKLWKDATKPCLSSRPPVLRDGDTEARSPAAQAQLLCDKFFAAQPAPGAPPPLPVGRHECKENVSLADDFTMHELNAALDKAAEGKAPGPLGLALELFSKGGSRVRKALLNVCNASWRTGVIPDDWQKRAIAPVLKRGKSPADVHSYRPIALLEPPCKLMQEMVRHRVELHVESSGMLDPAQYGFRRRRSTLHAQLAMAEEGYGAFSKREDMAVVFFDLKSAFDRVPHRALLHKLSVQYALPVGVVDWIGASLGPQISVVTWAGAESAPSVSTCGVSQGSPLSPLLFALYLNDLAAALPSSVGKAFYADDIAVWKCRPGRCNKLQKAVSVVSSWAESNAMELSKGKTQAILLSRARKKRPVSDWLPTWEDGQLLPQVDQAVYLGLRIDRRLDWSPHLKSLEARARGLLYPISALGRGRRGISMKEATHLYKACVASLWDQTLPLLAMATKSDFGRLQALQNKALRQISGMPTHTRVADLHQALGVDMVEDRMTSRCAKLVDTVLGNGKPSIAAMTWARNIHGSKTHSSPLTKAWSSVEDKQGRVVPRIHTLDFWRAELGGFPPLHATADPTPAGLPGPLVPQHAPQRLWLALRGPDPPLRPPQDRKRAMKGSLLFIEGGHQHVAALLTGQPLLRGAIGLVPTKLDPSDPVEFPVLRRCAAVTKGADLLTFMKRRLPGADMPSRLWLFADGACDPTSGEGAVGVWTAGIYEQTSLEMRTGKGWKPRGVELLALLLALAAATVQIDDARACPSVSLASDCKGAIKVLQGLTRPADEWERAVAAEFHGLLAFTGLTPALRWVPRTHRGIGQAHSRAAKARLLGSTAFSRPLITQVPRSPAVGLCSLNKFDGLPLLSLYLNKGDFNWDRWRRGDKKLLPYCDLCDGEEMEDIQHIVFNCTALHTARASMRDWFDRCGLQFVPSALGTLRGEEARGLRPALTHVLQMARRLKTQW